MSKIIACINERNLEVSVCLPEGIIDFEIRIASDRNKPVSKFSDISPLDPEREEKEKAPKKDAELWFPVVDIELELGMEAIAGFSLSGDAFYSVNGIFNKKNYKLQEEIIIPADLLEYWENSIYTRSSSANMEYFYTVKRFKAMPDLNRK